MIYVVTNSQGDVIALYDRNGNAVVEYQYDAWGNIISTTNTTEGSSLDWNEVNPFRYRGYYYDSETSLYYLQSRYYDAETGRFINQDSYVSTGTGLLGFNMFAYCDNNPVNGWDPTGTLFEKGAGGAGYGGFYYPSYGAGGRVSYNDVRNLAGVLVGVSVATSTAVAVEGLRQEVIYINKTRSRSEAQTKTKGKTRGSVQRYDYWTASIINNKVVPGEGLSYFEALIWAACKQNLLCRDHISAIRIVSFFPETEWEPAHKLNDSRYLNHYHIDRKHSNHIWYYGQ